MPLLSLAAANFTDRSVVPATSAASRLSKIITRPWLPASASRSPSARRWFPDRTVLPQVTIKQMPEDVLVLDRMDLPGGVQEVR